MAAGDDKPLTYNLEFENFETNFVQGGRDISKTTGAPKKTWRSSFNKNALSPEDFSGLIAIFWKFRSLGKSQQLWDIWGDHEPTTALKLSFRDVYDDSDEKAKLDHDKWMEEEGAALLLSVGPPVNNRKVDHEDKKTDGFTKHAASVFETLFTYLWMSWTNTSGISYKQLFVALMCIGPQFIEELLDLMKKAINNAIDTASSETKADQLAKIIKQAAKPYILRVSEFATLVQDLAWALSQPEGKNGYLKTEKDGSVIVVNAVNQAPTCVQHLVGEINRRIMLPDGCFLDQYRRKTGSPLIKKTALRINLSDAASKCVGLDSEDALETLMGLTGLLSDSFSKSQDELDAVQTKRAAKHRQNKETTNDVVDLVGEEEEKDPEKGVEEHRDSPLKGPAPPAPTAAASHEDEEEKKEDLAPAPPAPPAPAPAPAVTAASADDQDNAERKKRKQAALVADASHEDEEEEKEKEKKKKKKKKKKQETVTAHVQPTPHASPDRAGMQGQPFHPTYCEKCGARMEKGNCPRC